MSIISREIGRGTSTTGISVAVTASSTTTGEVDFSEFAGGTVYVPSGSSITTLTFYVAPKIGGTYLAAYDDSSMSSPAAVSLTVSAGNAYPIPSSIFGCGAMRMVGNTTGTVYLTFKG